MFYLQVYCQWIIKNNTLIWMQLSIIPSCTLFFLLFTLCNLLLSVFYVSLRVLSNKLWFVFLFSLVLRSSINYLHAVTHSILSSYMYREVHDKLLKTSCFSIFMTVAFHVTAYDQYLPYSCKSVGFFVWNSYLVPAV